MEQLQRGGRQLSHARRSNHLTVSAFPSVTNRWLGPLLFDWKKFYPNLSIHLEGSETEPRLEENEADFRISYGARCRSHQHYQHLFTDFVLPVGSPALLGTGGRLTSPVDVLNFPLLWIDWGPEHVAPPTWCDWLAGVGVPNDHVPCDLTYSLSSAALDAATEGRGLVLAQHSMVATALATGTLVRLFDRCLPLPDSYFLAWNGSALDKPYGAAFHAWLTSEAKRFDWQSAQG